MSYTRKEISEREGIRRPYICGAISASSFDIIELTGDYQKYKPFDAVYVFNNSSSLIYVYINQNDNECYPVAGKTEKGIDNVSIHDLKIAEESAANILAGEIVLTLEKTGITADTFAKKIARKIGW
jgi:hypothetical protein